MSPTLGWWEGVLPSLDLETTGVDPRTAMPVSVALLLTTPQGRNNLGSTTFVVDPGVEVPGEAAAIHGITTERARAEGVPLDACAGHLGDWLTAVAHLGLPLVIYNAAYDWPIVRRLLWESSERAAWHWASRIPLVDPLVLDRGLDRFRKGSRRLGAVCAHHGVQLDGAHDAGADAAAAALLARALARRHNLHQWDMARLQHQQATWAHDFNDRMAKIREGWDAGDHPWPGVPHA